MLLEKQWKIYVAGHRGLVGSAITNELRAQGYTNVIGKTRSELNLLDALAVHHFYQMERPDVVVMAAAKVGGILANDTQPAQFLYENLEVQNNVIHGAHLHGVKRLLFLGSSCIYPRMAPQPMKEEVLLSGPLEPTNQWYAIAKIAGLKMCEAYHRQFGSDFFSVMPTNMYGAHDNFDLKTSHVIPALIRKFHEAKAGGKSEVVCWGTGAPRREFLYSTDTAKACVFLLENYKEEGFINIGSGSDVSIKELSELVAETVGFSGKVVWDSSKPDGTPRKLMDSSRLLGMGWRPQVDLRAGLRLAYDGFLKNPLIERH